MTAWDVNVSHAASVKVFYWKCEILNNAWSKAGLPWVIWHLRPMEKQHSERNRNNTICLLLCCSSGLQWIWYRERYIQLERSTKQVLYLIPVGKKVCRVVAESLFTFSSIWLDKLNILHTVFSFLHKMVQNIVVMLHSSHFIQLYFAWMVAYLKWCSKNIVLIQHLKH